MSHDSYGHTIITQIRYAHYFEKYLMRIKEGDACAVNESESPAVSIMLVSIHGVPRFTGGGIEPSVQIGVRAESDHKEYWLYKSHVAARISADDRDWTLEVEGGIRVAGDIKIQVSNKVSRICHVWCHSQFMEQPPDEMGGVSRRLSAEECSTLNVPDGTFSLIFAKHEIDGAAKDSKNKNFPAQFQIEVLWRYLPDQVGTGPEIEEVVARENSKSHSSSSKAEISGQATDKWFLEKALYLKHKYDCQVSLL